MNKLILDPVGLESINPRIISDVSWKFDENKNIFQERY